MFLPDWFECDTCMSELRHHVDVTPHKFYELLEEELHQLFYAGIAGVKLKGDLLMSRGDQKGKEFDLGL